MLKKKIFFGLTALTTSAAGYYCYTKHKTYMQIIDTENPKYIYENIPSLLRNTVYVDRIYRYAPSGHAYTRKGKIKVFWKWFFEQNDFKNIPEANKTEEMYKFALTNYDIWDLPEKYWSLSLSNASDDFYLNTDYYAPDRKKELLDKLLKNAVKLDNFNITGLEMTGHEFNQLYPNVQLRKQMSSDLQMKNFQYKIGLNTDTNEFRTDRDCCPGGLYFSTKEQIRYFSSFGPDRYIIKIPDDENVKVYIESNDKAKASSLVVKKMNLLDKFTHFEIF